MYLSRYYVFIILTLAALTCTLGCQHKPVVRSDRSPVTGKVIYKGNPIRCGTITFTLRDQPKKRMSCIINSDGTFSVKDAPQGELLVSLETESVKMGGDTSLYVQIPSKYNDAETSGLTLTVPKEGLTDITIPLE